MQNMLDMIRAKEGVVQRALQDKRRKEMEWVREIRVPWESSIESDKNRMRMDFLSGMVDRGWDDDMVAWGKIQWEKCQFHTVAYGYVTLHNVCVRLLQGVKVKDKEIEEVYTSRQGDGRENILMAEVPTLKVGACIEEGVIFACRDKIPGLLHYKDGCKFRGAYGFDCSELFPVEMAEYFCGVFYVLRPLNFTSEIVHQGYRFLPHEMKSLSDYKKKNWSEGTMFLNSNGELRSKFQPTVELDIGGEVWECYSDNGEIKKLIPRPSKIVASLQSLYSAVTPQNILRKNMERYHVLLANDVPGISVLNGNIVIGNQIPYMSHLRPKKFEAVAVKDESVPRANTTLIGSKVIFFLEDKFVFLKEVGKKFDFVGGKKEGVETPLDTIKREWFEETGVDPPPFFYLTDSCDENVVTHVFGSVLDVRFLMEKSITPLSAFTLSELYSKHSDFQPWVCRILNDILRIHVDVRTLVLHLRNLQPLSKIGYTQKDIDSFLDYIMRKNIENVDTVIKYLFDFGFQGSASDWLYSAGCLIRDKCVLYPENIRSKMVHSSSAYDSTLDKKFIDMKKRSIADSVRKNALKQDTGEKNFSFAQCKDLDVGLVGGGKEVAKTTHNDEGGLDVELVGGGKKVAKNIHNNEGVRRKMRPNLAQNNRRMNKCGYDPLPGSSWRGEDRVTKESKWRDNTYDNNNVTSNFVERSVTSAVQGGNGVASVPSGSSDDIMLQRDGVNNNGGGDQHGGVPSDDGW